MFLSRKTFVGPYPRFTLKYHDVQIVQSMRCLGIKLDNKLNWSSHISYVSKNYIAKFKKLYELRSCQTHHLKSIYLKGVLPTVLYCIAIWGSCNDNMMQSLEKIHIRAARFICRIKKNIPNSDVLEKCKWKPLSYYYKKRLACIAHDIYYEVAPRPLLDIMVKKYNTRNTRNSIAFEIPKFKTLNYKHSFVYRAISVWNNLPTLLKQKTSTEFKNHINKDQNALNNIILSKNFTGKMCDSVYHFY